MWRQQRINRHLVITFTEKLVVLPVLMHCFQTGYLHHVSTLLQGLGAYNASALCSMIKADAKAETPCNGVNGRFTVFKLGECSRLQLQPIVGTPGLLYVHILETFRQQIKYTKGVTSTIYTCSYCSSAWHSCYTLLSLFSFQPSVMLTVLATSNNMANKIAFGQPHLHCSLQYCTAQ